MVKLGNDILFNCPKCYGVGFSVKLEQKEGGELVCTYNKEHKYRIENGKLKEAIERG